MRIREFGCGKPQLECETVLPQNKNQHFVPKVHFKPFSLNREGIAIDLLLVKTGKLVPSVSISGQCSRNYFYGKDLELEQRFQKLEAQYGAIVRCLEQENYLATEEDLGFLLAFTLIQYLRTEHALKRHNDAFDDILGTLSTPESDFTERYLLSDEELIVIALQNLEEFADHISDLRLCVIKNETELDFCTSDDPAIMTNRFHAQKVKLKNRGVGLSNAGTMLFLPLTPKLYFVAFDRFVYASDVSNRNSTITISNELDVRALNALQMIKAKNAIYFCDWSNSNSYLEEFSVEQSQRPSQWFENDYAVEVEDSDSEVGTRTFRSVDPQSEEFLSGNGLVHTRQVYPQPTRWFSKIRLRTNPRFLDTGSGAGLVRWKSSSHARYERGINSSFL